ncbi:unnamed protein product, partial [Gulo gulo]
MTTYSLQNKGSGLLPSLASAVYSADTPGTQPPGLCSRPPGPRPPAPARSPHPGANRSHLSCCRHCHHTTLSPIPTPEFTSPPAS